MPDNPQPPNAEISIKFERQGDQITITCDQLGASFFQMALLVAGRVPNCEVFNRFAGSLNKVINPPTDTKEGE